MKLLLGLIALAGLTIGCSTLHIITPGAPPQSFERVNVEARQYNVRVVTTAGTVHRGHTVRLAPDSVRWKLHEPDVVETLRASGIHVTPQPMQALPTSLMREVRIKNDNRGAWQGALFGVLTGAAIGLVADRTNTVYLRGWFYEPALAQWVVELVGGMAIGGITGSALGSPSVIRFQPGPAGSGTP